MINKAQLTSDGNGKANLADVKWPPWAEGFLQRYALTLNQTACAKAVGRERQAVYDLRKRSPSFKETMDACREAVLDAAEQILYKAAIEDPKFAGYVLARLRPDPWSERRIISGKIEHEHSGIVKVDGSIPIEERKEIYRRSYEAIAKRESLDI